jgi:hypothetical protein
LGRGVEYLRADVTRLPGLGGVFGAVVCGLVLMAVPGWRAVVACLRELRSLGRVVRVFCIWLLLWGPRLSARASPAMCTSPGFLVIAAEVPGSVRPSLRGHKRRRGPVLGWASSFFLWCVCSAVSYSPAHSRAEYHRRWWA